MVAQQGDRVPQLGRPRTLEEGSIIDTERYGQGLGDGEELCKLGFRYPAEILDKLVQEKGDMGRGASESRMS